MDRVVLLLLLVAPVVFCYSSGQVTDSCKDMRPQHSGLTPQTEPAPFEVATDSVRYRLGDVVKVKLQATASTPFRGFLLQAREVGEQSPVGSFDPPAESAQQLTCSQKPNSAVSHRSASDKTYIQVTWRPDVPSTEKPIQFWASVVHNYRTFWVDVRSSVLSFTNGTTGGASSPTSSPTTGPTTGPTSSPTTGPTTGPTTPLKTRPSTPTAPALKTTEHQAAPPAVSVSNIDCGVTKVCFSQPSNCDPTDGPACYFMSARILTPGEEAVHFEMSGSSDGYIAFGFSDDQLMGNDDIYICVRGSDGLVQLQHAFSTGRTTPQTLPLGEVSDLRASVRGRVISCSFTSMNTLSTVRTAGLNKSYHLLFAYGSSNNGQIQFHTTTFISDEKINISRPKLVGKAGWPHILKAHGALMLIAWMTLASLGMVVARYRNKFANGKKLWGKDVWFLVHFPVMTLTVTTTAIAFILPFAHVKAWSGGAHPVLGCLVMILSLIQTMMALLRCGPQHSLRFLFNWTHALNGVGIKALSVAAILTGLKMMDNTSDQWLMKTMGGFVGWEVLLCILLTVHLKWQVHTKDALESNRTAVNHLLLALFLLGNVSFLVALLVGIGKS